MRPRLVTAVLLMLASSAVACQLVWSYDDFGNKPDAASGSATSSSGSRSSSAGSGDSGSSDSTSSSSSSSGSSSSGDCPDAGDPCDCDGDGDRRNTADCDFDGGDCDDHDENVRSTQKGWFTVPGSNGWNYNCSNAVEFQFHGPIACPYPWWACDGSLQMLAQPDASECGQPVAVGHCVVMGWGSCVPVDDGYSVLLGCH